MAGPTPEQIQDLSRACIAVQASLSGANLTTPSIPSSMIHDAYRMSPFHAICAMAGYAAGRFHMAQDALRREHGEDAKLNFPREMLIAEAPPLVGVDGLVEQCVDVIEALSDRQQVGAMAERLLTEFDHRAFQMLAALTLLLGMQVVELDPDVDTLEQLVQQEALAAEQGWIDRGE